MLLKSVIIFIPLSENHFVRSEIFNLIIFTVVSCWGFFFFCCFLGGGTLSMGWTKIVVRFEGRLDLKHRLLF